jgi:hypothetical protein
MSSSLRRLKVSVIRREESLQGKTGGEGDTGRIAIDDNVALQPPIAWIWSAVNKILDDADY